MPSSIAREAATSSCVLKGLHPHHEISAPAIFRVRINTPVSFVTCKHPAILIPLSGLVFSYLCPSETSTGICASAHSIFLLPSEDKEISLILYVIYLDK